MYLLLDVFEIFNVLWTSNESRSSSMLFSLIVEFEEADSVPKATSTLNALRLVFYGILQGYSDAPMPLFAKQAMQRLMSTFRSFLESIDDFPSSLENIGKTPLLFLLH